MHPERAVSYRKQAGTLLESVLAEDITPRTAINTWPLYGNGDLSVQVAYTMLWYFEADEDRHKQEEFYPDVQVKALKEAATWLKQGEPLPLRLIAEYEERIAPEMYNPHRAWHDPLMWLMRQLHTMRCILETHPLLARHAAASARRQPPVRHWPTPPRPTAWQSPGDASPGPCKTR